MLKLKSLNKEFTTLSRDNIISELNAEELAQNAGSDAINIENKSQYVQQSIGIISWDKDLSILNLMSSSVSRTIRFKVQMQFESIDELKEKILNKSIDISDPTVLRQNLQDCIRSDIKLHCQCESYQYYRSYQMTKLDAAIYPEERPPVKNDPQLKRSHLCHHLLAALRYLMKYEQHIIEYLMTNDDILTPIEKPVDDKQLSQPIEKPIDKKQVINKAILKQLNDLIDSWSFKMSQILNDSSLQKTLSDGIKSILKKVKLVFENILKEEIDKNKFNIHIDLFTDYIVDNFVEKNQREMIKKELMEFISSVIDITDDDLQNNGEENQMNINDELNNKIREHVRLKAKKMVFELFEESPDDVNGPDPSAMNAGENVLVPAIKEYCNQTGKQMYENEFREIIIGIVRAIDTKEKIAQFQKMVGGFANPESVLRFEEPAEQEPMQSDDNFGPPSEDGMGMESMDTNEEFPDEFSDENTESLDTEDPTQVDQQNSEFDDKMEQKKKALQA